MKVMMTDTVESAHTIIPELEDGKITVQPGLAILSQTRGFAAGMTAKNYVLNLKKDAKLNLPERLGKKLVGLGYARAEWGK